MTAAERETGVADGAADPTTKEKPMLYALLHTYLVQCGGKPFTDENGYEMWDYPGLGIRDFETCLIWQLQQEGHYGERNRGYRPGPRIPVPA